MVLTYIPGFTNYLFGGPEIAYLGDASQPYEAAPAAPAPQALPTAQPVQTYISEFINYLSGGPEIAYLGDAPQPYEVAPVAPAPQALPTAQPVQTYIPGFTNYLSGGLETAYIGDASQPYEAAPIASAPQALPTAQPIQSAPYYDAAPSNYSLAARRAYDDAVTKSFGARGELSTALDQIDPSQDFEYSPTSAAYLAAVNNYLSNQTTGYNLSPMNVGTATDKQTGAPMPLTNAQIERYASSPLEDQFYANFNYSAPGSAWDVGNLQFAPNQQDRIVDRSTGDVLYSGTGYEAGAQASKLANDLFQKHGKMADWAIQMPGANEGEWTNRYTHDPERDPALGLMLGLLAPAIGAVALPALGTMAGIGGLTAGAAGTVGATVPTVLGTGLGAGLGTAALGTAQGKSIGDILTSSALSGLSAAGLQAAMQGLAGSSTSGASGSGGTGVGGTGVGVAPDPTVAATVIGAPSVGAGSIGSLGGALGSPITTVIGAKPDASFASGAPLVSSGLDQALGAAQPSGTNYGDNLYKDPIEVRAEKQPDVVNPGLGVLGNATGGTNYGDNLYEDPIEVRGEKQPDAINPGLGGVVGGDAPPMVDPRTIEVTGAQNKDITSPGLSVVPGVGDINPPTLEQKFDNALGDGKKGSTLSDIIDYLRLAGLGTSLLGGLFGGGSKTGTGGVYSGSGTGGLNPTFSAQLPGANIPGLSGPTAAPRTPTDLAGQGLSNPQDWYRYGYGPQQSFFNYVPQAAPNTSRAYTGYAEGGDVEGPMAHDTRAFAVRGPGDGREDKIDARLSDGEYVMDAETVALLGNGSSKAGAEKLDQFRVNLRKHKGRALARGKFSSDAKRPEQYLAGGTV